MCIIATQLPGGISLQMLDLFFPNSRRHNITFWENCLCLTFPDLLHALNVRALLAGLWTVIMPQTILHFLFVQLPDASGIPFTVGSAGSEPLKKKKMQWQEEDRETDVCWSPCGPKINV